MATSDRQLIPTPIDAGAGTKGGASLPATMFGSYALLWLGTLLDALFAIPIAGYLRGGSAHPFPLASPGTPGMAAFIATNNMREAAIPLLFATLRIGRGNWLVIIGDVVIGASLVVNVALGGLALGVYGTGILHYLPQWPLEWGGLALGLTGWRRARHRRRDPFELVFLALAAGILLCLAALLETYAVPQR
jgi:hypothetical protein